jgi:hypothetical protein
MNSYFRAASSLVIGLLISAFAQAAPSGGPLQAMQEQIDFLTNQYQALASRLERPKVSLTLSCAGGLSTTVRLSVAASRDIAYFAFQEQGGDPPANFVTFVQPGVTGVTRDITIDLGITTRTFLLVAADTDGNAAASLLQVPPDAC